MEHGNHGTHIKGVIWCSGCMRTERMGLTKINLMHEMFGEDPEHKCAECENLISHTASKKWYKCSCYGNTSSEATDWRLKYTACGLFNMSYKGTPIIEVKKHMPKTDTFEVYECEGQISIEDYLNSL